VYLVQDKETDIKYALKAINLQYLSKKERQNVLSEAELLRVITGPTVIRFFDSFSENNHIYILMEYAEGGSLAYHIQTRKMMGKKFNEE